VLIELKTARYKGVEFLFEDASTTGGNRLIKFNYPGSNKQAIEVQGKCPRSFNLSIIIPHENYYQDRNDLLRVLEDGKEGVFTHPTFGDIEKVINGEYTLTEELSELGRAKISVSFEVNDSPAKINDLKVTSVQVDQQCRLLNNQLKSDFADGYKVSVNFPSNFTDAKKNIDGLIDKMHVASDSASHIAEQSADFVRGINAFSQSVSNLIQAPADLVESIFNSFESLNNLFKSPEELLGAFTSLLDFGLDYPVVNPTTAGRIERIDNRELMRATIIAGALSYCYLNSSSIEYSDTDQLDLVQKTLEDSYLNIRNNTSISNEALEQLDRLRVEAQDLFSQVRVSTRSIITVITRRRVLSVLVYEYYGSTDLVDIIASLNSIDQNAFVEGNIRILSI
jgi:hypothetical protein